MTATFETIRNAFADAWEQRARPDGSKYWCMVDSRPEWMIDAVHDAHTALGGRMPDDWVYEQVSRILDNLGEYDTPDEDSARENMGEIADGLVDCYNNDRLQWLAMHIDNAGLCDEACEQLGSADSDMFNRIGLGQYHALDMIGHAIIEAIKAQLDDSDE